MAPPFKEALVDIVYGEGISQTGELIDMAADVDIINKAGSWYSYQDERIGQGRENVKEYLDDHPNLRQEIERLVRQHYQMPLEDDESPQPAQAEQLSMTDD